MRRTCTRPNGSPRANSRHESRGDSGRREVGEDQVLLPSEKASDRVFWLGIACFVPVVAALLYMSGLICFFRWEERAATRSEYFRRAQIRNDVYAPIIWLKAHDRSGVVRGIVQWEYRISHVRSFDPNKLQP